VGGGSQVVAGAPERLGVAGQRALPDGAESAPAAIAPEWPADSAIDEAAARSSPAEPPIEPAIAW
jgi:hypothetical protein